MCEKSHATRHGNCAAWKRHRISIIFIHSTRLTQFFKVIRNWSIRDFGVSALIKKEKKEFIMHEDLRQASRSQLTKLVKPITAHELMFVQSTSSRTGKFLTVLISVREIFGFLAYDI